MAGLLALGATLASGVLAFVKPESKSEQHLGAGRQLVATRFAPSSFSSSISSGFRLKTSATIARIADVKAKVDGSAPGTAMKNYETARQKIMTGTFGRDR